VASAACPGFPVVDADAPGRALPLLGHPASFHVQGSALAPLSVAGARDPTRVATVRETSFDKLEAQVRAQLAGRMAGAAALCLPPLVAEQ
ncbi:DUF917 family protein, partial [Streptococcus pneumoniae]|uniref:DUF917 family protein n=1 Tax=Streptococcus pneumoniae TaxID=1313 RepID=UPI0012D73BF8